MDEHDLKAWRERLGLSQPAGAEAIGVARRTLQYYEGGQPIPKTVALACSAVAAGLKPWPERDDPEGANHA